MSHDEQFAAVVGRGPQGFVLRRQELRRSISCPEKRKNRLGEERFELWLRFGIAQISINSPS